jgi:hypothetical protein
MATYRYLFADVLTGSVLAELPLYGVSFSKYLSKAGNFTGTYPLYSTQLDNADVLNATLPGRTAIYIERNGALVWGGIIWTRLWQSDQRVLEMTAQTFESYLYKQVIERTQSFVNVDQKNILALLVSNMQSKSSANIGITVPGTFSSSIVRSTTFWDYETWTYGRAAENLAGYADGLDWYIDVQYGSLGAPIKQLTIGDVLGQPQTTTQLAWDYPGTVSKYTLPESASQGATTVIGVGAGDGPTTLKAKSVAQTLLNGGYPDLQEIYSNKDVSKPNTLASQTQAYLNSIKVPVTTPSVWIDPDQGWGQFALGDSAFLSIVDDRFPFPGTRFAVRVVGLEARPPESDNDEELKLVLPGETDG